MSNLRSALLVVDGKTEIEAFRAKSLPKYQCCPQLRRVDCNGKSVTPEGYANKACGTVALALRLGYNPVVCVLDRERRRTSAPQLARMVKEALLRRVCQGDSVREAHAAVRLHVCVADRMFENWIVADVEGISVHPLVRRVRAQETFDGRSGLRVLMEMTLNKYKKLQHGPGLFCHVSCQRAKTNSPSFKQLVSCLAAGCT